MGECESICPAAGSLPPIELNDALTRFEREAVRGTCDTGRYRMPYFVWGEGPPLAFVHGLSDSSRSFLLPMSRLAGPFRCIGYDLPAGRGDGARLRRYRHDDLVADLFALLDHLGVQRSYVLGSSLGATIVLSALHRVPARLPRAILQGALAYRPLRRAERALVWLGRWLPGRMGRVPLREKVLRKTQQPLFAHRPSDVWPYFLDVTGRPPIAAVARQALWLHQLDLRPILPAIRQPVLLVCGDHDNVVPQRFTDVLLTGLPNAGRVILEGCGHMPSYTHPELYAEVIRRFLTPPQ